MSTLYGQPFVSEQNKTKHPTIKFNQVRPKIFRKNCIRPENVQIFFSYHFSLNNDNYLHGIYIVKYDNYLHVIYIVLGIIINLKMI